MACVKWSHVEMRKYRDQLYVFSALPEHCVSQQLAWDLNDPLHLPSVGVTLTHNELHKAGLSLQGVEQLHIRFRQGGESLRPRGRGCEKSLKTLFQEQGVPPWLRDRIPLLYHHDQLIFVLGYWIHEGY
jgi:tRNA(Ile)-lysidine synthase